MTPIALIHRQVKITLHNPRRLTVIVFLLFVIAALSIAVFIEVVPPMPVSYHGVQYIAPIESEVCVGGKVHFPISVIVKEKNLPTQAEPAESWCMPGLGGLCKGVQPANMMDGSKRLPLLKPKHIETVAERDVPDWLTPGTWEFWHSITDTHGNTEAYSVEPITVKDCTP